MLNTAEYLRLLAKSEELFYCYVIDTLSKEYGWTIEYIQNLTLPEISKLLKTIRLRKDLEDRLMQINVAKGFSGKISSNFPSLRKKKPKNAEAKNLEVLAKMFGKKTEKFGKVKV